MENLDTDLDNLMALLEPLEFQMLEKCKKVKQDYMNQYSIYKSKFAESIAELSETAYTEKMHSVKKEEISKSYLKNISIERVYQQQKIDLLRLRYDNFTCTTVNFPTVSTAIDTAKCVESIFNSEVVKVCHDYMQDGYIQFSECSESGGIYISKLFFITIPRMLLVVDKNKLFDVCGDVKIIPFETFSDWNIIKAL